MKQQSQTLHFIPLQGFLDAGTTTRTSPELRNSRTYDSSLQPLPVLSQLWQVECFEIGIVVVEAARGAQLESCMTFVKVNKASD